MGLMGIALTKAGSWSKQEAMTGECLSLSLSVCVCVCVFCVVVGVWEGVGVGHVRDSTLPM